MKGAAAFDISTLASEADLGILKTKVDNLDIDKLKTVPADLRKLCNVLFNDVVKRPSMMNCLSRSYQVLVD